MIVNGWIQATAGLMFKAGNEELTGCQAGFGASHMGLGVRFNQFQCSKNSFPMHASDVGVTSNQSGN